MTLLGLGPTREIDAIRREIIYEDPKNISAVPKERVLHKPFEEPVLATDVKAKKVRMMGLTYAKIKIAEEKAGL